MKPPATSLGLDAIRDPVVRSAVEALNGRDEKRWYGLFSEDASFSDDGIPRDLVAWCGEELFGSWRAYLVSIDMVEDAGLKFYAKYHSDKWGDFKTFWRFALEGSKISRLDVGATNY